MPRDPRSSHMLYLRSPANAQLCQAMCSSLPLYHPAVWRCCIFFVFGTCLASESAIAFVVGSTAIGGSVAAVVAAEGLLKYKENSSNWIMFKVVIFFDAMLLKAMTPTLFCSCLWQSFHFTFVIMCDTFYAIFFDYLIALPFFNTVNHKTKDVEIQWDTRIQEKWSLFLFTKILFIITYADLLI